MYNQVGTNNAPDDGQPAETRVVPRLLRELFETLRTQLLKIKTLGMRGLGANSNNNGEFRPPISVNNSNNSVPDGRSSGGIPPLSSAGLLLERNLTSVTLPLSPT